MLLLSSRLVTKFVLIVHLAMFHRRHLENSGHAEKLQDGSIANFNQWVEPYLF